MTDVYNCCDGLATVNRTLMSYAFHSGLWESYIILPRYGEQESGSEQVTLGRSMHIEDVPVSSIHMI